MPDVLVVMRRLAVFEVPAARTSLTLVASGFARAAAGAGADLSDEDPSPLGSADPGVGEGASRFDHVHPMPSAADVGAASTSALASEASTRAAADTTNASAITAEATARAAAIAALSGVYQPLDSDLTAIAALTTTTFGRSFLALVDAAAGRTLLGLGTAATTASTAYDAAGAAAAAQAASQPLDSDLTAIAALTTTTFGRALLALADAAALRTVAGLVIGTDVEAHDPDLTTFASLTPSNDDILQRKAGAWTNRTLAQLAADLGVAATALVNQLIAGFTIPAGALSRWKAGRGQPVGALNGAITNVASTATLSNDGIYGGNTATKIPLLIDDEWVFPAAGMGSTSLSSIGRGLYGTTGAAHADGAAVRLQRHIRGLILGDSLAQGEYPLDADSWIKRAFREVAPSIGGLLGAGAWPLWRNQNVAAEVGTQNWRLWGGVGLSNASTSGLAPTGATQFSTLAYTASARASNVVTLTVASGHGVVAGMSILVLTGTFTGTVTVTSVTSTTIVYTLAGADNATGGSGTIAGGARFTPPAGTSVQQFDVDWVDQGTTSAQWSYSLDGGATWIDNPVASTSPSPPDRKRTRIVCDNPSTIDFRAATAAGVAHQFCLPGVGFTTYNTRMIDGHTEGVIFDNLGYNGVGIGTFVGSRATTSVTFTDAVVTNGSADVSSATAAFVANDVGATIYVEGVAYTILQRDATTPTTKVQLTANYAGTTGTAKRISIFQGSNLGDPFRAFDGDRASLLPHLAILGPWTNDQAAALTVDGFGDSLTYLASRLKTYADVILVSPPEQNGTPDATRQALFRAKVKAVGAALGVAVFDMYDAFAAAGYTGFTACDTLNGTVASGSGFMYDTLHPSPLGNRFLGSMFARMLRIV